MFERLFYPMQTLFVCTRWEDKTNIAPIEWVMPASSTPDLIALSVGRKSYTIELLSKSKEFSICAMPESSEELAMKIGGCSGRIIDKFSEFGIDTIDAKKIRAPVVKGCLGWVECTLDQMTYAGDNYLVVGDVVETSFNEESFGKIPALFRWGGKSFFGMSKSTIKEIEKVQEKEKEKETAKSPELAKTSDVLKNTDVQKKEEGNGKKNGDGEKPK